jgi:uncharacterized membrane protein YcaP (DUF421 family)
MKYASVFATILFIWIAAIATALIVTSTGEIFELYLAAVVMTVILFIIGFGKK